MPMPMPTCRRGRLRGARRGGFGLVKRFAARVLRAETGQAFAEPLSGQRAVRGPLLRSLELASGFGLEIGLTLDAAARGASISEVAVEFAHRQTGRDISGFAHRARIGRHVYRAVVSRLGGPKTNYLLAASLLNRMRLPARTQSRQPRRVGRETSQALAVAAIPTWPRPAPASASTVTFAAVAAAISASASAGTGCVRGASRYHPATRHEAALGHAGGLALAGAEGMDVDTATPVVATPSEMRRAVSCRRRGNDNHRA